MGDLVLKSLIDLCAEVLIAHPKYIRFHTIPEELCHQLWDKMASFDCDDGLYHHNIKEPQYYTSFKEFQRCVKQFYSNFDHVRGNTYKEVKEKRIAVIYALFDYLVENKPLFLETTRRGKKRFGIVVKRKIIQLYGQDGLSVEKYWEKLFDEPFPERSAWRSISDKDIDNLTIGGLQLELKRLNAWEYGESDLKEDLQQRLKELSLIGIVKEKEKR